MNTNPYEPLITQNVGDVVLSTPVNWRAILLSVAICFVLGLVLGGLFGVIIFSIAIFLGPSDLESVDGPIIIALGYAVGIIPVICGAIFLGRQIKTRLQTHAFLYAIINLLISGLFMLLPSETGISWADLGYYILQIPISVACVLLAARFR